MVDERGFDPLAKRMGASTRRDLLGVLGMIAGLVGAPPVLAAERRRPDAQARKRRCRSGQVRCGGRCRDVVGDPAHCGGCGRACGAGQIGVARTCCQAGEAPCDPPPNRPFPQGVPYPGAAIRPNHRTAAQQADDVRAAYDRWKARYLVRVEATAGKPRYRVAFGKPGTSGHRRTVSEGQGYGMLIVAQMAGHDPAARTIVDGLWRFVDANPSTIDGRLMSWQVPERDDSAFDGDADIAYGLLFADAQWGSGGEVDYAAEATKMLAGIVASTIGPESRLPMLGGWVDPNGATFSQQTTRPSDFMLANFRAFRRFTNDPVWETVMTACQSAVTALQRDYAPGTGLLPDFVEPSGNGLRPASPRFLRREGANDGDYFYNAGRVPWRMGLDALLSGNPTAIGQASAISRWAEEATGGEAKDLRASYELDGTPVRSSDYFTSFFAAPIGVAAMLDSEQQDWLNALYDAVRDRVEDYYEDSVALLCLLVMAGTAWDPTT